MDSQFERYWHLALARFSPLSSIHEPLLSFHSTSITPFEQQIAGFCKRLYYLPNCKVVEMYETNRCFGEKLGLNTREKCWFYERWQGEGEDRVWVKAWNRKGREWGEVNTVCRDGRKVTYWKEEESGRKIGEYSQQGSSECIKKLQVITNSSSPSYLSEFTLKSSSSDRGEKLHLTPSHLSHTKWETTKKKYQGETLDLTFPDLEDAVLPHEDSEEDIQGTENWEVAESCREAMVEIVGSTVEMVRKRVGEWREVEELEDCLNRLKTGEMGRGGKKLTEVMKETGQKQQMLISRLLSDVRIPLPHVPSLNLDTLNDSYTPNPRKLRLSFGPVLDTSDSALLEDPTELEDTSDTRPVVLLKGGLKSVPRNKVKSGLNALGKIRGRLERRKLTRVLGQWRDQAEEMIRGRGSFVGLAASPKAYLWSPDRQSRLESRFEAAAESHLSSTPSFTSLFESILQREYAYLTDRSHLQHCYKRKGDPSQASIGPTVFALFEELMDRKYLEVRAVRGREVPLSLSQFFCEQLVPRKGFTRLELKRFSQFMRTLLSMQTAHDPYGLFICRLLRIAPSPPIFDTAGRMLTQIRYELLQTAEKGKAEQYYTEIKTIEAVQAAKRLLEGDIGLLECWLEAIPAPDLPLIQKNTYWISQFLAICEPLEDFASLFGSNSASFSQFRRLKQLFPLSEARLTALFQHYADSSLQFTSEAWERMITEGDFLRLKHPVVPLWAVFEAVLKAFEALQRRICAQIVTKWPEKEEVTEAEVGIILETVLPGLQSEAYSEVYCTAKGLEGSVSAASVVQAIIRLKLETR